MLWTSSRGILSLEVFEGGKDGKGETDTFSELARNGLLRFASSLGLGPRMDEKAQHLTSVQNGQA